MAKLKLTYFDVNGGRAEPIRLALFIGGIEFEDHRFAYSEFAEVRKTTPLGQVPVLEIDGKVITQSNALTTYAGKLAGLYPTDDFAALLCEEVMGTVEDVTSRIVATFCLSGEQLASARTALIESYLVPHLKWLDTKLGQQHYLINDTLTVADLKVLAHLSWLNSGKLDHIPNNLVSETVPKIQQYFERLMKHPKIAHYYQIHQ